MHDSLGCVALWRDFPAQLAQYSGLPVIASGGVTNLDDVRNLKGQPGILGAITGRAIYEGSLNLREAQLLLDEQSL